MTDPLGARGVNVFGFVDGVLGIGEDVRALANALLRAGIPMAIHGLDLADRFATSESHGWHSLTCGRPLFPVSVFCLPPFETLRVRIEHGSHLFDGRHNIGYWPWELTSLPKELHGIFSLVDEVWSSSGFLTGVYTKLTEKPVRHMPPYLNLPKPTRIERADFGIGADDFVVLVMFDFNSFTARKNPEGAIAAFRAAFADMSGSECLVVKTLNGHAHPEAFEALKADLLQDPRMVLIDGPLSREETAGLIELADVYVSLHRSEGFGRILAEAMLLGTPVVATDWSGSKDFLNEDTGWPVAFVLRDVLPHEYIYASGSRWAEPSVEDATKQLKAVRTSPAEARRRAAAGRRRVEAVHSLDAVARAVSRRLLPPTATGALAGTRTNGAGPQPVRTSAPGDAPPAVRVHRPTKPAG
jgi:glycosyltransferase involved in cell wall biosynthesis